MTILEMEPYILGIKHTRMAKAPVRVDIELFNNIWEKVIVSNTATKNLAGTEIPKDFYRVEPDIAQAVPRGMSEEIYYCLKNGYAVPEVPAKFIYLVRKAYSMYKIPNLIFKSLSKYTEIFFQENYLVGNLTPRDVVCSFCDKNYIPFNTSRFVNKNNEYTEVYIKANDMAAFLPNDIATLLSIEDIMNITVDTSGMKIGDKYLKFLAGHHGATRSVYDLRYLK